MLKTTENLTPVQPLTITLSRPLKFGDEQVTTLELREPTAGDMRKLPNMAELVQNPFLLCMELAVVITDIPMPVLDRMALTDLKQVTEYLSPLVLESLGDGAT